MAIKVLVADDEKRIRKIIGDYLKNEGYCVIEAEDGEDALAKFHENKDIDLIIVDVMMPKKNGWQVCEQIRSESEIPIIFLTALGECSDETYGLDIGADDYIVKPFRYEVFIARVRAVLRRLHKREETFYSINEIEIDTVKRTVKKAGEIVELSPKEYELLIYLIKNERIALERDRIIDAVWGYDYYGDRRTVDTHIKNIRAKIGSVGNYIKTIRGFGYRFEVNP
ncbi:MAG: response regulator transcription factor [Caulobacteraceae bacterium]